MLRPIAFVVGIMVLAAPLAAQETPSAGARLSVRTLALPYLGGTALADELEMTLEQRIKLAEHLGKWWRDYFALPAEGRDKKLEEMSRANDHALAGFLKPGQLRRLEQIILQQAERRHGLAGTLRYPAVAEAISLKPEQLGRLARAEPPEKVLDKEQLARWQSLRGEPYLPSLPISLPRDPRRMGTPAQLLMLTDPAAQKDVKLSDDQAGKVKALMEKWQRFVDELAKTPEEGRDRKRLETIAAFRKDLDDVLQPEQRKRLDQILTQERHRLRSASGVFADARVLPALGLSAEQRRRLEEIDAQCRRELAEMFAKERHPEETAKEVRAFRDVTYERLHKVLTADQQAKLKDAIGEPFRPAPASALGSPAYITDVGLLFATQSREWQDGLRLTEDQVARLREHMKKWAAETRKAMAGLDFDKAFEKRRELGPAEQKELAAILPEEQLRRFKNATLQSQAASSLFPRNLTRLVDVVDELKLTAEQIDRLRNKSEPLMDVLDREQQAAWKKMLGEPFPRRVVPAPTTSRPVPLPQPLFFAEQAAVQKELGLSDEQAKKVGDLVSRWREEFKKVEPRSTDEIEKKAAATVKALEAVLNPKQKQRLEQIQLQSLRQRGLAGVHSAPEAQQKLALTEKQIDEIATLARTHRRLGSILMTEMYPREFGVPPDWLARQTRDAMERRIEARLAEVLTAKQRTQLSELLGAPFAGAVAPTGAALEGGFTLPGGLEPFDPPR